MTLCGSRSEGFGPKSHLLSPLPTTCFIDTILIPLPIFISLLLIPILCYLSFKRTSNPPSKPTPQSWLYKSISTLYYLLILANILMEILEIVRLSLIHYGIGLLPFVYIGLIITLILHYFRPFLYWEIINYTIWLGSFIFSIVKLAGLGKVGMQARKGSKYPNSDQIIDVAVITGVYAVVGLLEIILGLLRRRVGGVKFAGGIGDEETEFVGKYPSV